MCSEFGVMRRVENFDCIDNNPGPENIDWSRVSELFRGLSIGVGDHALPNSSGHPSSVYPAISQN